MTLAAASVLTALSASTGRELSFWSIQQSSEEAAVYAYFLSSRNLVSSEDDTVTIIDRTRALLAQEHQWSWNYVLRTAVEEDLPSDFDEAYADFLDKNDTSVALGTAFVQELARRDPLRGASRCVILLRPPPTNVAKSSKGLVRPALTFSRVGFNFERTRAVVWAAVSEWYHSDSAIYLFTRDNEGDWLPREVRAEITGVPAMSTADFDAMQMPDRPCVRRQRPEDG